MQRAAKPGVNCVKVNEFIRRVDIFLAKQNNQTIVPCAHVIRTLKGLRAMAMRPALGTNRRVLAGLIDSVYQKILGQVECRGNTMVNVGALRMYLDRIRCVPATATTQVLDGAVVKTTQILVSAANDAQPVPEGFVKPRVLPPGWSAREALAGGWIRHPVHDWLQPADTVVDLPMPGAKKPGVTIMAPGVETPQTTQTQKTQKTTTWILVAVLGAAVLGLAGWWWMRRRAAAAAAEDTTIGTSALFAVGGLGAVSAMDTPAIAEAFDNVSPPSPENGYEYTNDYNNNNEELSESIF